MGKSRSELHKDDRPSAKIRRENKQWLLDTFGDGITALCSFCEVKLTFETITQDRYPIPGRECGKYIKGNIRPACLSCNSRDGALARTLLKASTA